MKYFSTFSGIGGFELGIGDYGKCVGYSEVDKYAIQTYEKHFNHKNYGDITKIKTKELPNFDLFVGGFPCQSFSIAGKRMGFSDTRGTLFFEIARIIKAKKPKLLLLENVKGLLSHDNQQTFETILCTLSELGYDVEWQVLNSKNFGVPQNRERVFIIGHLRGKPYKKIFPIIQKSKKGINVRHEVGKVEVRKHRVDINALQELLKSHRKPVKQLSKLMKQPKTTVEHWFRSDSGFSIPDRNVWMKLKKILNIKTDEFDNQIMEFEIRDNKFDMANRVYGVNGVSPTLTTLSGGQQHVVIDSDQGVRRLTPVECERLQGFPDNWTNSISENQRYKTLGNAVTVNVIKELIHRIYS